jgi:hypothetical protein
MVGRLLLHHRLLLMHVVWCWIVVHLLMMHHRHAALMLLLRLDILTAARGAYHAAGDHRIRTRRRPRHRLRRHTVGMHWPPLLVRYWRHLTGHSPHGEALLLLLLRRIAADGSMMDDALAGRRGDDRGAARLLLLLLVPHKYRSLRSQMYRHCLNE